MDSERELEMARRHVAEGRMHLARQQEIIEELAGNERDVVRARALLSEFKRSQRLHEDHLAELESRL